MKVVQVVIAALLAVVAYVKALLKNIVGDAVNSKRCVLMMVGAAYSIAILCNPTFALILVITWMVLNTLENVVKILKGK